MSDEAALLNAIRAHPDEDAPRLAYADWLDEYQPAPGSETNPRAELIRTQIELARRGDYDTSPSTNALRDRAEQLLHEHFRAWTADFRDSVPHPELQPEFRRGFPDHLRVPARWFLECGEAIRRTLPALTALSVYRLNGWGERFAQSPHLRGLRELRVPCWTTHSGTDVIALANSPHPSELERLTIWLNSWWGDGTTMHQRLGSLICGSRVCRHLKQLTLVWDRYERATAPTNYEAGRQLAVAVDPRHRTFPFAAHFHDAFFVGRLPDGRQVFAACPWIGQTKIPALLFDAAGTQLEQRSLPIPAKDLLPDRRRKENEITFVARRNAAFQRYRDLVCEQLGAEPADIRVRQFDLEGSGVVCGIGHMSTHAERARYVEDDPGENPDEAPNGEVFGAGGVVEPWLGDHGMFIFTPGDGADTWIMDGRGRIAST